jgi:polysaccharide biosynthesis/export protein
MKCGALKMYVFRKLIALFGVCLMTLACQPQNISTMGDGKSSAATDAPVNVEKPTDMASPDYRMGPGDTIQIFVWRNPELSATVPIRPDGRFSTPLIEDMQAAGKTPTELAKDLQVELGEYVQSPKVTVVVAALGLQNKQNIRVLGEATNPSSLPYRAGMTALDVLIAVGGLTDFADGNNAVLIRTENGEKKSYRIRLGDLVQRGDISADRPVLPGDTLIIPEAWL